jgi:flagellin-like hook-associated protein FlgL
MSQFGYSVSTRQTELQQLMFGGQNIAYINAKLNEIQRKIASGKQIERPSDDPLGTVTALQLEGLLGSKAQFKKNVGGGKDFLSATDTALADITDLISHATQTAMVQTGVTADDNSRQAAAMSVHSMLDDMVLRANAQFAGRYLFAGTSTGAAPLQRLGDALLFTGNNSKLYTKTDVETDVDYNVTADEAFRISGGKIAGTVDLNPTIDGKTQLRSLNGGRGVGPGSIVISDGTNTTTVDLSKASSVADVIAAINAACPATTTADVDAAAGGIRITSTLGGACISVDEAADGSTARDLGIYAPTPGAPDTPLVGGDLNPDLTLTTPVSLLKMSAGLDLASGIRITNGNFAATVTFEDATTIQDILNKINSAGVHVKASISADKSRIEVTSMLVGPELRIGETTGTTAQDLGIRTFNSGTLLSGLNKGVGVRAVDGDDFRITTRSGATIDVDVSACRTIGDVIDAINSDAQNAGKVVAGLAASGNGIRLVDATADAGSAFSVTSLDSSQAASDLGILKTASAGVDTIGGDDVNGVRSESPFTHLMDLRDALNSGDEQGISRALANLDIDRKNVLSARAETGNKVQRLDLVSGRIDQEVVDTKGFLSRIEDADLTSILVQYSSLQTALQASLKATSDSMKLSLMDYL